MSSRIWSRVWLITFLSGGGQEDGQAGGNQVDRLWVVTEAVIVESGSGPILRRAAPTECMTKTKGESHEA